MSANIIQEDSEFDAALNRATSAEMDAFFAAMMEEENDGGTDNGSFDRANPLGIAAKPNLAFVS